MLAPIETTWYNQSMASDKTHKVIYQDGLESEPLTKAEARRRSAMSYGAKSVPLTTKMERPES